MSTDSESYNFVEKALAKWRDVLKSIGGSEIDERHAFSNLILEGLLGYDHTKGDYQSEERGTFTDIAVYDKQHYKVVVIETKRSDKAIDSKETIDQAFGYATSFTRYVGLSNLREFTLYKNDKSRKVIAQINFKAIFDRGLRIDKLEKGLLATEYANIDMLRFISKEEIYDDGIFDNFVEGYHAANVKDANGFSELIRTLEKCVEYLYGYGFCYLCD